MSPIAVRVRRAQPCVGEPTYEIATGWIDGVAMLIFKAVEDIEGHLLGRSLMQALGS
jgi:hypothetical protein